LLAIGRFATEMRFVPFTETLGAALDKVRAALSSSAQRELVQHLESLRFVGVPALPAPPDVRAAVERAWFEREPLTIRYRAQNGEVTERAVAIRGVLMDRGFTLLDCDDFAKKERRQLRLDRIERARRGHPRS
jgi:predicted DNA-binding transcriptional regulator YafY